MGKVIIVGLTKKVQEVIHKFPAILEEVEAFAPPRGHLTQKMAMCLQQQESL